MTAPLVTPQTEVLTAVGQTQIDLQAVLDDLPGMVTATTAAQTTATAAGTAAAAAQTDADAAQVTADAAIPKSALTATGALLGASAASTPSAITPGTLGYVLTSNGTGAQPTYQQATAASGLAWRIDNVPASPDARDEEFTGTAFSGWTENAGRSGTAIDVQASFNTASTWRASWNSYRPGWLMIQPSYDGSGAGAGKAITVNTNDFLYSVVSADFPLSAAAGSTVSDARVGIAFTDAADPASVTKYVVVALNLSGVAGQFVPNVMIIDDTGAVTRFALDQMVRSQHAMAIGLHKIGTRYHAWVSMNGRSWSRLAGASIVNANTMSAVVFTCSQNATPAANEGNPIVGLKCVRLVNSATNLV